MIVRVSDVYPDGRSILVVEYAQRARYRHGFDRQELMTPGAIVASSGGFARLEMHGCVQLIATCPSLQYVPFADEPAEINFDIGWTSMTFNTGHRIRVAISSSGCE